MPDDERQKNRALSSLLDGVVSLTANGEQRVCSRLERVLTPVLNADSKPTGSR